MTYKDFPKVYIGDSDIAALVLVGPTADGMKTALLDFGEDNAYQAYIVEGEDVEIGSHYHLDSEWENWLSVYDDTERTYRVHADHIRVYRAGEMGCIIQHWDDATDSKLVSAAIAEYSAEYQRETIEDAMDEIEREYDI